MEQMIAFCGLDCLQCPAYIATQADDDEKRRETALMWSKVFKTDISIDKINCDGCNADDGRLFHHCSVCEIRACAREKGLANCAHCDDFACTRLDFIFNVVPTARQTLEKIRAGL
jgi:Protein of unknown function (DUF3795)